MSNDPVLSPAFPQVTESMLVDTLDDATMHDLAKALDPTAFTGARAPDCFRCPDCSFREAVVLDEFRWQCPVCSSDAMTTVAGQRTRLALRRAVAEDYEAARRLIHDVNRVGVQAVPIGRSGGGTRTIA